MRVYPLASQDRTFGLTHAAINMSLGTSLPHESHHAELGGFSIGGSEIRSGGRARGRLFPGPVCTENLNPNVMVMKAAKDRV